VFNSADPDNPDVGDSDFAWSTMAGLVDANGDETIDLDDCHVDVIGSADILGNDAMDTNPCGFATASDPADNGKVDLDGDGVITSADSCDRCFLGQDLEDGLVVVGECAGYEGDPRNQVVGTGASETLPGTSAADIVCAKGGDDVVNSGGGKDLVLGGGGADLVQSADGVDTLKGGGGRDELRGGDGGDTIQGGDGNDSLYGWNGADHIACGAGNDTAVGGPGKDTFSGCEHVTQ
jgi:Ca2+-binding RTX toxin-like protein